MESERSRDGLRGRSEVLAPGERVTHSAGEAGLSVDSQREKPRWLARRPGTAVAPEYPGAAIEYDGRIFEVLRAEPTSGGYRYELAEWDDRFPVRQLLRYDRETAAAEAAAAAASERRAQQAGLLQVLVPLAGLLPADLQLWIERERDVPAVRLTTVSAFALLLPAVPMLVLGLAAILSGAVGGSPDAMPGLELAGRWLPLTLYVLAESTLRLASVRLAGEPMGSLPVVVLVRAAMTFTQLREGKSFADAIGLIRVPVPAERLPPALVDAGPLSLRDEVRPLALARVAGEGPFEEGEIEVVSLLPKEHWTKRTLIRIGEAAYVLERQSTVEAAGQPTLYRFQLRPAPVDTLFAAVTDYVPEEVQALGREALRRRRETWVQTFAQLWGLLDDSVQGELAATYRYEPEHNTAWSIAGVAVLALVGGGQAINYLLGDSGGASDLAVLLGAAYFAHESWRRYRALRQDRILPSVLAHLVRPFALRLLRW